MKKYLQKALRWVKSQAGQGLVEYSIILALILLVVVLVLRGVGTQTNSALEPVNEAFENK